MKKWILSACVLLVAALSLPGQTLPADKFKNATLVVQYTFSGTDKSCDIAVDELLRTPGWAGRTRRLDQVPLRGNGQIRMTRRSDGQVLYRMSFSTLFQEWQATEEATRVRKSFENVFQLPMPDAPVDITVELYDFHNRVAASLTHPVDPDDILIRPAGHTVPEHRFLRRSGPASKCIDVVIVSEGYTEEEMDVFYADARAAVESILSHEPFKTLANRFNFVAVALPSNESGVSIPKQGLWVDTALGSSFDTFYSDRYLTTLHLKNLHERIAGVPYEHIIILANTDNYGGGGIYNSYTLTAAHHPAFRPVVVHEFGHSFGGLADEYFYDDQYTELYYPDVEPWEPNITTKADFASKWQALMGRDGVGLYEGGGYQSKGVWRGSEDCRMKTNSYPAFCPVCQDALSKLIHFYTD